MKHTKSMTYKPSDEARELLLYATNHGDLYRQSITPRYCQPETQGH